jgi:hypothetical protein
MELDSLLHVTRPRPEEVCEESSKRQRSILDTVLHDVNQPPPESCEEEREKLLEPESDSDSDSEFPPELEWVSKPIEYLKEKYDNDPTPQLFQCSRFVYKNKAQEKHEQDVENAVIEYLKIARNLSPYDAIPIPPLALENQRGHNWPRPVYIGNDKTLKKLIDLSKIALDYYNNHNQGAEKYVFVGFVKAAWRLVPLGAYYITFQAKEDTDSDCLARTRTFQAYVINKYGGEDEWTEVKECTIKPGN